MRVSFFFLTILLFAIGCEDDVKRKYPIIKTNFPSAINSSGALFTATIEHVGGQPVLDHGFTWFSNGDQITMSLGPTSNDEVSYYAKSGLASGPAKVKAYLKTSSLTVFGEEITFASQGSEGPVITSFSPTSAQPLDTIEIQGKNLVSDPLWIASATNNYLALATNVSSSGTVARFVIPFNLITPQTLYIRIGNQYNQQSIFPQTLNIQLPYWKTLSDFPGPGRENSVSFALNGKGYVCTGRLSNGVLLNDFWQYDPSSDQWTQLANFPGQPRANASAFVVGGKAYVGLGETGPFWPDAQSDLWEFDPGTLTWTSRANYPGGVRRGALAYGNGSMGYVGGGKNNQGLFAFDFWQYDPQLNTWTQKDNLPLPAEAIGAPHYTLNGWMVYFDSNGTFHKTLGNLWKIDSSPFNLHGSGWSSMIFSDRGLLLGAETFQVTGEITTLMNFPYNGPARLGGFSFVINGKGYYGLGTTPSGQFIMDVMEFDPSKL